MAASFTKQTLSEGNCFLYDHRPQRDARAVKSMRRSRECFLREPEQIAELPSMITGAWEKDPTPLQFIVHT